MCKTQLQINYKLKIKLDSCVFANPWTLKCKKVLMREKTGLFNHDLDFSAQALLLASAFFASKNINAASKQVEIFVSAIKKLISV